MKTNDLYRDLLRRGRLLEAIKELRDLNPGLGLIAAKEYAEADPDRRGGKVVGFRPDFLHAGNNTEH